MSLEEIRQLGGELFDDPGPDGLIARGFLRGAGLSSDAVRRRPVIGIANTWSELNPCNGGLRELAADVKRGVVAAGGLPLEFPTISVAETFTRPSSLYLRNLLAMDTEEMIRTAPLDGVVLLGGCDKTIPAQLMGATSAGKPCLVVPAGPRALSSWRGESMTVEGLWPLLDERRAGNLDDNDWADLEGCLSAGVGTCNVMGTATTMAVVAEVLGMALPGSALLPAASSGRRDMAELTGRRIVARVKAGITPRDLLTAGSVRNAFRVICAVGGSTNAVIHLQALAHRAAIELDLATMKSLSDATSVVADVKPTGSGDLHDLEADGGVPAVIGLLAPGLDLDALAGDDRPWRLALRTPQSSRRCLLDGPALHEGPGSLAVLSGSLAPAGAILKRAGADPRLRRSRGRAVVFDGVADLRARIDDPGLDVEPSSVLVLRGAGPVGAPGMPEVGQLPIPTRLLARGVRDMVRISDARMSGTAVGTVILHVAPEAAVGGPLALVRDGDLIELDTDAGRLDLQVPPEELARRRKRLVLPTVRATGYERLYRAHVLQADRGCDFALYDAPEEP
jgi:dihydroxy-acid dehydratase